MPKFETDVILPVSPLEVFEFLLRPANVKAISPPELGLVFIDPPEIVSIGSRLMFKVQSYGQVQTFVHQIDDVQPQQRILETQVQGLFRKWVHEHQFELLENNRTRVIDRIDFEGPGGLIGLLVSSAKIQEQLEEGFEHRHDQLRKFFG